MLKYALVEIHVNQTLPNQRMAIGNLRLLSLMRNVWTGEVRETATSCRLEELSVTHDDVLLALLRRLETCYVRTLPRQFAPLLEAWTKGGGKAEVPEIIPI